MANLYRIPQYRTTTLSVPGGINNSQTTGIILADLPADLDAAVAGILALTWANPVDEDAIEYITYTSINTGTNEVQGVTRGAEGFSARAHDNQATVAWVVSKSHVNNVVDRLEGTDTNLVRDPNGNELFLTTYVSSAVNYVRVKNAATGNGPEFQALGDDTNIDLVLQAKGTGAYALKGTATASAEARLYEDTDNGTNYIGLKAPASVGTSKTFVLPDADGSANQVLKTDGSATLGWVTPDSSMLANRTRNIPLGVGDFVAGVVGTAAVGSANGGNAMAWLFDAAATEDIWATAVLPEDLVTGSVTIKWYWSMESATSGNVALQMQASNLADGVAVDSIASLLNHQQTVAVPGASDTTKVTSFNTFTATAGQAIRLRVIREGDSGADTAAGDLVFYGLEIEYTSDM